MRGADKLGPRRQGRHDFDGVACDGVVEFHGPGMEAMADLVLNGKGAIDAIIDNMNACERELGANLVGHACVNCHFKERAFFVFKRREAEGTVCRDGVEGLEFTLV